MDLKFLPLCAFIYLLNYLDRGNIGAAKIMNEETNDDILQVTGTSDHGYSTFRCLGASNEVCKNANTGHVLCRCRRFALLACLCDFRSAVKLGYEAIRSPVVVAVLPVIRLGCK